MVLRNFNIRNNYLEIDNNKITEFQGHTGNINGYFQKHAIGTILFSYKPDFFLKIKDKIYNTSSLKEVRYIVDGETRKVDFIYDGNIIDSFEYKVFWINEADIIQFALEFPSDDEMDILKFISNKINNKF